MFSNEEAHNDRRMDAADKFELAKKRRRVLGCGSRVGPEDEDSDEGCPEARRICDFEGEATRITPVGVQSFADLCGGFLWEGLLDFIGMIVWRSN